MTNPTPSMICVDLDGHGRWGVSVSDPQAHLICETLDDARRMVYLRAAGRRSCELVIRDAYHRVVARELVPDGADESSE